MQNHEKWTIGLASLCSAVISQIPDVVRLLIIAQIADMIMGMMIAYGEGKLSSAAAWTGMRKKSVMIILVVIAFAVDRVFHSTIPVGIAVSGYYCAVEILSITENAAKLGVPIAPALRKSLAALNKDEIAESDNTEAEKTKDENKPQ